MKKIKEIKREINKRKNMKMKRKGILMLRTLRGNLSMSNKPKATNYKPSNRI